jgi:hypothetical protein
VIAPASAVRQSLSAVAKTYAASAGVLLAGGAIAAAIGYAALSSFGSVTMILLYLLTASVPVGIGTGIALGRAARFTDPETPWSTASAALACLALSVGTIAHLSNINLLILIPPAACAVISLAVELRRASETR